MKNTIKFMLHSNANSEVTVMLRLVLGVIFIGHGWGKLFAEGNPAGFAGWLGSMGLEPSYFLAVAAGLAETLGGALLILGLATRFAALNLIMVMIVAIVFVHLDAGMFGQGGYEFQLLLLTCSFFLAIQGAGKWSLDTLIHAKLKQ